MRTLLASRSAASPCTAVDGAWSVAGSTAASRQGSKRAAAARALLPRRPSSSLGGCSSGERAPRIENKRRAGEPERDQHDTRERPFAEARIDPGAGPGRDQHRRRNDQELMQIGVGQPTRPGVERNRDAMHGDIVSLHRRATKIAAPATQLGPHGRSEARHPAKAAEHASYPTEQRIKTAAAARHMAELAREEPEERIGNEQQPDAEPKALG